MLGFFFILGIVGDTWGDYRGTLLGTPKPSNTNGWGDWGHFLLKTFFIFFYFINYIYPKKSVTTHQQHNNNTMNIQTNNTKKFLIK